MIKLGLVGLGNIGQVHIKNLTTGLCPRVKLHAVSDFRVPASVPEGATFYANLDELLARGGCDAVLLATPTKDHSAQAIKVLQAGLHVLVEKPVGLSKAQAQAVIAAAKPGQVAGVMLNQRSDPAYLRIRELVQSGAIGQIQRTNWIMTNWFRPEIYFQSSPWRATWPGEGGGLLLNQCIHNLDIFQWICGVPSKIRAWCKFGRYHDIEVEDECTAYFEYANGATGLFVGSTGEAPGSNRLEIAGDKGSILLENRVLTLTRNSEGAQGFSRTTQEMFGQPGKTVETLSDWPAVNQHATLLNDFAAGVLDGAKMIAPASDGLASLEFANGFILSTWLNREIDLPLDAALYESELAKRVATSKPRTVLAQAAPVDMSKSYR